MVKNPCSNYIAVIMVTIVICPSLALLAKDTLQLGNWLCHHWVTMCSVYLVSWVACACVTGSCVMGSHITGACVTTRDCQPVDWVMLKSRELSQSVVWCMKNELLESCKGRSGQG